jgi:murein endopeptidase
MFWVIAISLALTGSPEPKKKRWIRHKACVHQIKSSPLFKVRNPKRSYGTKQAIHTLKVAAERFSKRAPGTSIRVGDMSWLGGGRMRPHASHRKGLDVDLGYFRKATAQVPYFFYHTTHKTVDAVRTWALVEELMNTKNVEYIFMGRDIQSALYKKARAAGYSKRTLSTIFQYPRNSWKRKGIIRWSKGHNTHFHVRFRR